MLRKKITASEISSNPRRQFLESLLPEVDERPETTFRQFKRQVLHLIDRLNSNTFNPIPFSLASHSLHSQSPSLHYSNPSSVDIHIHIYQVAKSTLDIGD